MTIPDRARIPLLTPAGYDAYTARRADGAPLARNDRLAAVAAGTHFFDELPAGPDADGDSPHIATLIYRGRFHQRWIAVDFGGASMELRRELAAALRRTGPNHGGLLITDQGYGVLPEHVQTLGTCTEGEPRWSEPWYLVQLSGFILRALGPTRVLCLDLTDAALMRNYLGDHATAIACTSAAVEATPRARGRAADGELLGWLRGAGNEAQLSSFRAECAGATRAASEALASAGTLFVVDGGAASPSQLRRRSPRAGLVSATPAAFAAHLAPTQVPGVDVAAAAPGGELSVVFHDVTPRDRERAPIRAGFACLHLLGDLLAATPVLRAYRQRHPEAHVTLIVPDASYARVAELCPEIDCLAYVPLAHAQIVFGASTDLGRALLSAEQRFDEQFVLDIQAVARTPETRALHMSEGYARSLGVELTSRRPAIDRERALSHRPELDIGSRYAVLARHTVSGSHVGPRHAQSKRWREENWVALARRLKRAHGLEVVSIGTPEERRLETPHALDVHCLSILQVAGLLAEASLLVSVDNGVYHLAQGLRTPTVHLYPGWFGPHWVASDPEGPHIDLVEDLRGLSVRRVLAAANRLLGTEAARTVAGDAGRLAPAL